jgi:ATPase family associated with various cellular activities (AAA)
MVKAPAMPANLYSLGLSFLAGLLPAGDLSAEAQFLRSNGTCLEGAPAACLNRYLANPAADDRPLLMLAHELGLSAMEPIVISLAAAVETDLMCGRAIAHLQAPLAGSRPTLGLLAAALSEFSENGKVAAAILTGVALEAGLLQISSEGAPLAERPVSVPVPICLALDGRNTARNTAGASESYAAKWPGASTATEEIPAVPLPASVLAAARKHALGLSAGARQSLALRSGSLAEAKAAACEIARLSGARALFIDIDNTRVSPALAGLGPWLLLNQFLPVFCFELGPGERKSIPALPHYRGPRLAICGPEGTLESGGETLPGWTIGVASREERTRLWETAVGNPALARELSGHRHGSGRIAQLGRMACRQSVLEGRSLPQMQDIVAASWTPEGAGLESLAQPLECPIPDEALVLTPALREELNRLLLRCRGREGLVDGLGASASAKYRPGVRALFTGPSGTGKTLAAGWLATRLGLPLYRIDLAAVTSKYIGETEKNLAQVLARAEHAEVILLFDEADSMFGKRTDVKESNDRFANAQTNYLLQRIESFDGIVFLTSNSRARFDPAFFRRLDAIVEFPVPGPVERRSLWQSHLGAGHLLSQRELNQLSAGADLLGGNIRNAVLAAAVVARAEKRSIAFGDLLDSVASEYRKLGRQVPSELQRGAGAV